MTTTPTVGSDDGVGADTALLGRGLAVIRILFGVTFLANGLAKLFELHRIEFGPYLANLINRGDARFILDAEVNRNARHQLPLVGRIANDVVLAHWGLFGWALTAVEITAGALLLAGLASRLGALLALGPTVLLFFVYFANDRWLPEQPLGLVPLVVLALVPAGRWWGMDRRFAGRGWPF